MKSKILVLAFVFTCYQVIAQNNSTSQADTVNSDCIFIIEMNDMYSDGWNGGNLKFFVDGNLHSTHYLSMFDGSTKQDTVMVSGSFVSVDCLSGSYPNESSFTIYNLLGDSLFYASSLPSGQNIWSDTVNCEIVHILNYPPFNEINTAFYINPSRLYGFINIHLNNNIYKTELQIYNLHGQLIKRSFIYSGENKINIQDLPQGLYILNTPFGASLFNVN